ncbi:MAG: hypothetical protein WA952_12425 [Lewinella sp.]
MSPQLKIFLLLCSVATILLAPYLGAQLAFSGNFSDTFFAFPPLNVPAKSPFSLTVFLSVAAIGLLIVLLYAWPRLYGFRPGALEKRSLGSDFRLPPWFWIGLLLWGSTLILLWGKFERPLWWINWAVIPLFWGFTLLLDGIVFRRTGGLSLFARQPHELLAMGLASCGGWMIFEWLNFFVNDNWYYPHGDRLSDDQFLLYAFLGSSGLMVMSFEWYSLFNSWEGFRRRYANGPRITFGKITKIILLVLATVGLFTCAFIPDYSFGILWTSPLVILTITLSLLGIWTPFQLIREGNWTPVLFLALTYFIQGFLCECWNYFSGVHVAGQAVQTINPDYWVYSIPFVDVLHVFEMPMLGLGGYLPFGIYCGVWWIVFAYLLRIPTQFNEEGHYDL